MTNEWDMLSGEVWHELARSRHSKFLREVMTVLALVVGSGVILYGLLWWSAQWGMN